MELNNTLSSAASESIYRRKHTVHGRPQIGLHKGRNEGMRCVPLRYVWPVVVLQEAEQEPLL